MINLDSLLWPTTSTEFMTQSWPHEPFVTHDLGQTIAEVRALPFLQSLDTMLNAWPELIQVHLPDVADESSAIEVRSGEAKKLFQNKMALLFNNVQRLSPDLQKALDEIKNDLGLPKSTYARCMVYATPDGKGTAPHFDQNINFVLQLHGTKTWWLAPNSSVMNPTERHTIGQDVDPELEAYLHEPLPNQMPEPQQEVRLKPGSLLFVPRGYWHRTEAEGEALALNFTFNQPTWMDLLTLALRSRLSQSPMWRELADGVNSENPKVKLAAAQRFDEMLMDLTDDLPNWRAEDILGATEGWEPPTSEDS